jgi:hypothetical protein
MARARAVRGRVSYPAPEVGPRDDPEKAAVFVDDREVVNVVCSRAELSWTHYRS